MDNPAIKSNDNKYEGWMKACQLSKDKLVMHFLHYSCENAEFCHNERGAVLKEWIDDWRRYCIATS